MIQFEINRFATTSLLPVECKGELKKRVEEENGSLHLPTFKRTLAAAIQNGMVELGETKMRFLATQAAKDDFDAKQKAGKAAVKSAKKKAKAKKARKKKKSAKKKKPSKPKKTIKKKGRLKGKRKAGRGKKKGKKSVKKTKARK